MRFSRIGQLSFVGALWLGSTQAAEPAKVHDEALKVLREKMGTAGTESAVAPGISSREMEKAQGELRRAGDAQAQVEKRRQFENQAREKERLRQAQRQLDENAAGRVGLVQPPNTGLPSRAAVHDRALEVLRSEPAASASEALPHAAATAQPALEPAGRAAPSEAELAPRVTAAPSEPARRPQPSPYLQERLRQIEDEIAAESASQRTGPRNAATTVRKPAPAAAATAVTAGAEPAASATPDAYHRELEERARAVLQQQRAATPPSALDARTREMLQRQDQEISKSSGQPAPAAPRASSPLPVAAAAGPAGLDAASQAKAREVLAEQQPSVPSSAPATPAAAAAAPEPFVPARPVAKPEPVEIIAPRFATPAPVTAPEPVTAPVPAPAATTVAAPRTGTLPAPAPQPAAGYSKELEERARQILLERAQAHQAAIASAAAAPVPATAPATPAVAAPATTPAPAPVSPDVHAQALAELKRSAVPANPPNNPSPAAEVTGPKTKQQRLKELTELYRADKMTPAEYHQRRAQILGEPN